MTHKPRKGDFGELKSEKIPQGNMPPDPVEACTSGAHLRNTSVLFYTYVDPRVDLCVLIFANN